MKMKPINYHQLVKKKKKKTRNRIVGKKSQRFFVARYTTYPKKSGSKENFDRRFG